MDRRERRNISRGFDSKRWRFIVELMRRMPTLARESLKQGAGLAPWVKRASYGFGQVTGSSGHGTATVGLAGIALLCATALSLSCTPKADDNVFVSITVNGGEFGSISSDSPQFTCNGECKLSLKANSTVEFHPLATSAGSFQGWSGDCTGTDGCKLTVAKDARIIANFGPRAFSLHVAVEGPGVGAVQLPDGSSCSSACDVPMVAGQRVHLGAIAHPDSYFGTWSGACTGAATGCDLEAADGLSVTAQFGKKLRLDVTGVDALAKGAVTSSPAGIDCVGSCTGWFLPGEKVTLTVNTTGGLWRFHGWSGADCSTSTCEVIMDSDKTIAANVKMIHVWSRSFGYQTAFDADTSSDGNLTVAVVSSHAQDFGAGSVMLKPSTLDNLFVARVSGDGVPLFTKVFGGSAKMNNPVIIRERPNGGFSVMAGVQNPGGSSNLSVDLGGYQVVVAPSEFTLAYVDFDSAGNVTGAGPVDLSFEATTVVQSGSTTFAINALLNSGGDTISALGPDWTRVWTLRNPKQRMKIFAGPSDTVWAMTSEVPMEMNCVGGPAANGALLRIDANGTCTVVWAYPQGIVGVYSAQAPGGAPMLDVGYSSSFEFAGNSVPEPPMGWIAPARLRFDVDGVPKWSAALFNVGGTAGEHIGDTIQLENGEILMAGHYTGISEFDPTVPEMEVKEYLATYSDQTGDLQWHASFGRMSDRTSMADFEHLAPLPNGRVALWGVIKGTFDFGGGPVWSPTDNNMFVAVYQF